MSVFYMRYLRNRNIFEFSVISLQSELEQVDEIDPSHKSHNEFDSFPQCTIL